MNRSILLFITSCLLSAAATASQVVLPDCPGTKLEENRCYGEALSKAEVLLNRVYRLVIQELASGTNVPIDIFEDKRRTLVQAQRAWVQFRKAQCDAEMQRFGAGSGQGEAQIGCTLSLTNDRIRYLSEYAAEIGPDSNLCQADKTKCELPSELQQ
jgi:uncharacterized protein YecT (DUF1311 family)